MYEEVMQVPMLWHWPGKLPVASVRPELVSFYDFLPSMCEVAGTPVPQGGNLAGRSYLPLAKNQPLAQEEPVAGHGVRAVP